MGDEPKRRAGCAPAVAGVSVVLVLFAVLWFRDVTGIGRNGQCDPGGRRMKTLLADPVFDVGLLNAELVDQNVYRPEFSIKRNACDEMDVHSFYGGDNGDVDRLFDDFLRHAERSGWVMEPDGGRRCTPTTTLVPPCQYFEIDNAILFRKTIGRFQAELYLHVERHHALDVEDDDTGTPRVRRPPGPVVQMSVSAPAVDADPEVYG